MKHHAHRFFRGFTSSLASLPLIFGSCFWFLGNSVSPSLASPSVDRITGAQAVEHLSSVLGSPQTFKTDMKNSTQDFIADHFGTMAIAAAFGIAIRMRS
ncbi:MAG: hypothetical protein ACBR15_07500 [Microcoleus sp.]